MSPEQKHGPQNAQEATEAGYPEAYVPPEVLESLVNKDELEDDLSLLKLGCRISPKGLRTTIFAAANGFYTEDGYHLPFDTFQTRTSALLYGYFCDLFSKPEFDDLLHGKKLTENLASSPGDMVAGPVHQVLGSRVYPTLEEVALDIERRKKDNPELKTIFIHGRWNNVPHPGHIFSSREIYSSVSNFYNIPENNLVIIVSCDNNSLIRASHTTPFLNTLWRVSMMSYIPWVDYVCPSGDFIGVSYNKDVDRHWAHKYQILKPDFVNVDPDSPQLESITQRIKNAGAIPVISPYRTGAWIPEPGNPMAKRGKNPISATNIRDNKVDINTLESEFNHLLLVKHIRDEMYGARNLFNSPNLLRLDKSRGYYPVKVEVPQYEENPFKIQVPELPVSPNEKLLHFALGGI